MIPLALLSVVAIFQAATRSIALPLTLVYTASFLFAYHATSLDFTHSLLVNSILCVFVARLASDWYDGLMIGVYIAVQFVAIINYSCAAVFYAFLTQFYTQAITLYNSLNDMLVFANIFLLIGMSHGGSRVRNRAK